ncbi:MAG: hypothetical protein JWO30_2932 [Fibrobacteres bacterium]|nr:hypothetical protein [Fibrobacterota bacterium]
MVFPILLALLLAGCQSQEGLASDNGDGRNTLATALSVPPPKFADNLVAQGLNTPMAMEFAPDGRLFVLEKSGAVKIVQSVSTTLTFLTLNVDQNTERGLLGIAFDPNWANQKYVYIHYSVPGANANRISRFTVSAADANKADPASEVDLFDLSPLITSAYHNGGALHFGIDGYLYVTTGDNRLQSNGQDLNTLLGKILRFSKVPGPSAGTPTIPSDNPFFGTLTGKNKAIWGYGLRNPFTFAVQPGSGRIFINDVGEDGYEEINDASAGGRNFGWSITEGPTTAAGINGPIGGYVNGSGVNAADCAIVGAAFYNPNPGQQKYPSSYLGDYFYGDHCSQYIRSIDLASPTSPTTFATSLGGNLMDLKVNPLDGALYYLTLSGTIGKIDYTGTDAPSIARQPASQTVSVGQSVTFSVEANGSNLVYRWQKNGVNIPNAVGTSYTIPTTVLADNNTTFQVFVSNALGTVPSSVATLTVITNQPPVPVITTPVTGTTYTGGQTITFAGSGSDPEDGALGSAAGTWRVDLIHDAHSHPFMPDAVGFGGPITIPTVGETSPNVSYRIFLTVKDSKGLTATTTRDVLPVTASVTIASSPSGLQFLLDGQPKTTPFPFTGVVGIKRTLEALSPQTVNGANYQFVSWSDGLAAQHDISTPAGTTTITATYGTVGGPISLPGRIQAEAYKNGGENVGYHDLDAGNTGTQYRTDNVDIEATTDAGGGYNVGWIQAGEWLAYDVNVASAGAYIFTARMASAAAGTKTVAMTVDNGPVTNFSFTDASGWQSWKDVAVSGVNLTAGSHVLRLTMTTGNFNLNYMNVAAASGTPAINLPGRIQAEAYKNGGETVGYHDLTLGNTGNQYRTDNVDIEATTDVGGGFNVGWVDAGEWLAYDVNVASAGTYTLTARLASGAAGTKSLSLTVDGGTAIPFSFSDASGWQSWKDVVVSGVSLSAGAHTVRFTMPNGNMNINYLDVAAGGSANLLANGDFSNGIVSWQTIFTAPATGTIANEAGSARMTITNAGANPWDIQIYQPTPLTQAKVYTLDFDIKSEATPKSFEVVVEHNGSPWTKYFDQVYSVTAAANTYQHFTITWTQSATDAGGRIVFDFGAANVNDSWLDNVFLK